MATKEQAKAVKPMASEFARSHGMVVVMTGPRKRPDGSYEVRVAVEDIPSGKPSTTTIDNVPVVIESGLGRPELHGKN